MVGVLSKRRTLLCTAAAALSLPFSHPASAAVSVSTSFGSGADSNPMNDVQDAGTGPAANRGTTTTMQIRNSATRAKAAYFRFDLSGVTGNLHGATLTLPLTFNNGNRVRTLNVYGLIDNATDDAWAESSTHYSNAPGFTYTDPDTSTATQEPTNSITIDSTKLTQLGTFATPSDTTVYTTFTTSAATLSLDAFLDADTNDLVTFAITLPTADANAAFDLSTKENTNGLAPILNLPNAVAVPVPEPTSAAMLGLGALTLISRRRRR